MNNIQNDDFVMESRLINSFINYISSIRRFSQRTCAIYRDCLNRFLEFAAPAGNVEPFSAEQADSLLLSSLVPEKIRRYEAMLMNCGISPRTVNLHVSAISSFCKFLIKDKTAEMIKIYASLVLTSEHENAIIMDVT